MRVDERKDAQDDALRNERNGQAEKGRRGGGERRRKGGEVVWDEKRSSAEVLICVRRIFIAERVQNDTSEGSVFR